MRQSLKPRNITKRQRTLSLLNAVALFTFTLVLLAACAKTPPPSVDPDPDPPTGPVRLVAPAEMNGVTRASVRVEAEGPWRLSVAGAMELHVSLSPNRGNGDANVTLTVDPDGLPSYLKHPIDLRLTAGARGDATSVLFSFPDVHGYALRAAPTELAIGAILPFDAAGFSTAAVDAVTATDGSVTLMVGTVRGTLLPTSAAAQAAAGSPGGKLGEVTTLVNALGRASVTETFPRSGVLFVKVDAAEAAVKAARIAALPGVRYVELPVPLEHHSNDEFRALQWNLDAARAESAWPESKGAGVTVAVLDSGFYPDHPDLRGNVVGQYDAGDQKESVRATREVCGTHGTHVAGIVAATADNWIGIAGTAPEAGLYLVDLDVETNPECEMTTEALVRALEHVLNDGNPRAEIINMSIGSPGRLGPAVEEALQDARDAGIILVASAGNTACEGGAYTSTPVAYPAAYEGVWAVAATRPDNTRACYSHVGEELLIAAPGGDTWYDGRRESTILSTDHDFGLGLHSYGWMEGTSMAAPLVAGVAALLKGAVPTATETEVRNAATSTAINLGSPTEYGHGLINAAAAMEALVTGTLPPEDEQPPLPELPTSDLYLRVEGYPLTALDPDGIFTLEDAPVGPLRIEVESDDYYGEAWIDVRFDQPNNVFVELRQK